MRTHAFILVAYITPAINAIFRRDYSEYDICYQRKEKGTCKEWTTRYYYNPATVKCEIFWYSGCLGNENNFVTYRECQRRCAPSRYADDIDKYGPNVHIDETERVPVNPACLKPRHPGNCHGSLEHFYYNATSEKCEAFTYTGCGGNANNFASYEKCHSKCSKPPRTLKDPCTLPRKRGPCSMWRPRYFYNVEEKKCEKFLYGGCLGNRNNFYTLEDCERKCGKGEKTLDVCMLPQRTGDCKEWQLRYGFNRHYGECQVFVYGGCNGNENNFETEEECSKICPKREPEQSEVCSLPRDRGPCSATVARFHYDMESEECMMFVYGGCMGNANNFQTYDQCQRMCRPK